jgi:hypothetical protein
MSDEEFCKFSTEIKKLERFADKYAGLWATYAINIPDEGKEDYLELKHPLGNYEDVKYRDEHQSKSASVPTFESPGAQICRNSTGIFKSIYNDILDR